jgi:hypothetical protein
MYNHLKSSHCTILELLCCGTKEDKNDIVRNDGSKLLGGSSKRHIDSTDMEVKMSDSEGYKDCSACSKP